MTHNLPSTEFRTEPEEDLLTIYFAKSSSRKYKYALSTAETADNYKNVDTDGSGEFVHMATYPPNVKYLDLFIEAEKSVRENKKGFWKGGF